MPHLSARTFYGIILAGFVLGIALAAGSALAYRESGGRHATGRGALHGIADELVLPVAVIAGATFGGLAGVGAAVWASRASHGTGFTRAGSAGASSPTDRNSSDPTRAP